MTDADILALGLYPFRVRLSQMFRTSPVCVFWDVPVHHETLGPVLVISGLKTFTGWN